MTKPATPEAKTTEILLWLDGAKGSGKTALVDLILMPALGALGGRITERSVDDKKNMEVVSIVLPEGALKKLAAAPDAPPPPGPRAALLKLDSQMLGNLYDLVRRRDLAKSALEEGAGKRMTSAPLFVPVAERERILTEAATEELLRIDRELADMGVRLAASV